MGTVHSLTSTSRSDFYQTSLSLANSGSTVGSRHPFYLSFYLSFGYMVPLPVHCPILGADRRMTLASIIGSRNSVGNRNIHRLFASRSARHSAWPTGHAEDEKACPGRYGISTCATSPSRALSVAMLSPQQALPLRPQCDGTADYFLDKARKTGTSLDSAAHPPPPAAEAYPRRASRHSYPKTRPARMDRWFRPSDPAALGWAQQGPRPCPFKTPGGPAPPFASAVQLPRDFGTLYAPGALAVEFVV